MAQINSTIQKRVQAFQNKKQIKQALAQLYQFLMDDLNDGQPYTHSRARAMMRASNLLEDAAYSDFQRMIDSESGLRAAFYDLINSGQLTDIVSAPAIVHGDPDDVPWLALAIAAHAYQSGYQINNLDPASPPQIHTPAGMMLQRSAQWIRSQNQRSATDRDRLARKLAYTHQAGTQALEQMPDAPQTLSAAPPHFRTPVPVSYPEYNPPVQLEPTEESSSASPQAEIDVTPPTPPLPADVERGTAIQITANEIDPPAPAPTRMPPLTITSDQVAPPPPPPQIQTGNPVTVHRPNPQSSPNSFVDSLRNLFATEHLKSTRLHISVQEYPDGPGLYGLQVRVTCRGIRSFVAGTTSRNGRFICELPVRDRSGLTYDVDVTWPREAGGETERKSITLNGDRTDFSLPFYQRLKQ